MAPYHEVLVVSCVYLCVYVRAHLWLKVPVYSLSIDYLICTGVLFFFMKNSVTIPNPFCHNGGRGRRWKEPNNCFYLTVHTFCKHVARLCNITVNLEILRQLWLPGVSLVVALSEHWILHDNSRCTAFQKKKDHDKIPVQVFPKVWPPLKWPQTVTMFLFIVSNFSTWYDCHKRGWESYQECLFCAYKLITQTNVCSIYQDVFKTYNAMHAICKRTS